MKRVLGILTFAVIGWGMTSPAQADTYLRFCLGAGPCTGADPTFSSLTNVVIAPPTTLGSFTILSSTAVSEAPGAPSGNTSANSTLVVKNIGSGVATITVEFSATNYLQPAGDVLVQAGLGASGSFLTATTVAKAQGFADDSNAAFGFAVATVPPLVCQTVLSALSGDCAGLLTSTALTTLSGPYSVSGRTTITLAPGSTLSPTLTVAVSPVPVPGSMMLLGTGLFGLAGVIRRRMTNAVRA